MFMGEQPVTRRVSPRKLLALLFMLPLTCGTVCLKPSLFLKRLQFAHSQLFISAGLGKLWPRAGSRLSE